MSGAGVGGADPAELVELTREERTVLLRNPHDRYVRSSPLSQKLQIVLVIGFVLVMIIGLASNTYSSG